MKYKNILLPMLFIWYLDLITTLIGLSVGLSENNPKAAYFFKFGAIGWGYWFVFGTFFIIILSLLIYYADLYISKKVKKTSRFFTLLPMIVFLVGEACAIINNLFLIFKTL